MSTHEVTQWIGHRVRTRTTTLRARLILSIGPLTALGGALWAVLQPDRITLLHPLANSFWWLFVEPPIYVVLVGVLFHMFVARALKEDLEEDSDAAA
jgi:uncharacterized membrane protein